MAQSKRTQRALAVFNHIKYNTKQRMYSIKQIDSPLEMYINAYQEVTNVTIINPLGQVAG